MLKQRINIQIILRIRRLKILEEHDAELCEESTENEAGKEILQPNQANFSTIDLSEQQRCVMKKSKIMPSVSKCPNWNLSLPNYVTLNFSRH